MIENVLHNMNFLGTLTNTFVLHTLNNVTLCQKLKKYRTFQAYLLLKIYFFLRNLPLEMHNFIISAT